MHQHPLYSQQRVRYEGLDVALTPVVWVLLLYFTKSYLNENAQAIPGQDL